MKIVIDRDIPFIRGVFEQYADVLYLPGKEIDSSAVSDADALVVRTRTKCNESLLAGSRVQFIATATIGTDHIDLEYCRDNGIGVANAAGCNAGGVMQYVFTALYALAVKKGFELPCGKGVKQSSGNGGKLEKCKKIFGVIGVGNVGSRVASLAEILGFEVLRCDPLKEREQTLAFNAGKLPLADFKDYYSLEYLLKNSDIVSMHTWLDNSTRGMADSTFFSNMKDGAIFVNASRGEVVDDAALLQNIGRFDAAVIDVWNGEPVINMELLAKADIATPHIAGYSYEGKMNGTTMAVRAVAGHFSLKELEEFEVRPEEPAENCLNLSGANKEEICKQLTGFFPIFEDDYNLRSNPADFEKLRSNYKYRREFYVNSATKTTNN